MRDTFEKRPFDFYLIGLIFFKEGYMSDTFDYYVSPSEGEELLALEAE